MYLPPKNQLKNSINFLDIIKARNTDSLQFSKYTNLKKKGKAAPLQAWSSPKGFRKSKPTSHNIIKHETSCHPPEQNTSLQHIP